MSMCLFVIIGILFILLITNELYFYKAATINYSMLN